MSLLMRAFATGLIIAPALALAQAPGPVEPPPAPVGHSQPNASDVPPGDSVVGGPGTATAGSPVQITPQERRDNAIDRSLCATPTC